MFLDQLSLTAAHMAQNLETCFHSDLTPLPLNFSISLFHSTQREICEATRFPPVTHPFFVWKDFRGGNTDLTDTVLSGRRHEAVKSLKSNRNLLFVINRPNVTS